MAGRKSKYSSENSNTNKTKIWSVALYIRLSQEDEDNHKLIIDKESAEIVRKIFEWKVNEGFRKFKYMP